MIDLQTRFKTLDRVAAPDLWYSIEERALAMQPDRHRNPWLLVAVMLLLTLVVGGAMLVGTGIVKLPAVVDASAGPSATANASADASSGPVAPVPASWTATGELIEARTNHTATRLLDGRVLVAGGTGVETAEFFATFLASAELYDPETGTWTATGSSVAAGPGRTATLLGDGTVLVVGGGVDLQPILFAELYDPDTGQWTRTSDTLAYHGNHTATLLLDGRVLVAGEDSAEIYDPMTGQWTATGVMPAPTIGHTATRLLDGGVLVAGSAGGTAASAAADLFDPDTGRWTATGAMTEGRISHKATLMPGGGVLVIGGTNSVIDVGVLKASAELYDPVTGSWTATASMAVVRTGHTVTLLSDGSVLVVGGTDGSGALSSAERYAPGSGT